MALFRKPSQSPGDAPEPSAMSSADWAQTIATLHERLAASEAELISIERERDADALSLAMADEKTAAPRLSAYASRIAQHTLNRDNLKNAIARAAQRLEEAEATEARDREGQRIAAIASLSRQYTTAVQGVDDAMAGLAAAFRAASELFDRIFALQTTAERGRSYILRTPAGPTCAAFHCGLNSFLDLDAGQNRGRYQSLSDFAKPLVAPPAPPPVGPHVSESAALSQPHSGTVN